MFNSLRSRTFVAVDGSRILPAKQVKVTNFVLLNSPQVRFQSGSSSTTTIDKAKQNSSIDPDSIYVIALPITTHKSYIYCHHRPSILHKSQLNTYPIFTRLELKLTGLASKGWNKIKNSDNYVNKNVTKLVMSLLNSIPYDENCLTSFPTKNSMIREVNEEALSNKEKVATLVQSQIEHLDIPANQLKPIPLYHPKFQKDSSILQQLQDFRDQAYAKHLKYSIWCGIGIPISLPLIILPVVPNVPGLYLTYRLYCHIKSLMGAKHLAYLLENNHDNTNSSTQHLDFKIEEKLDAIYRLDNFNTELKDESEITKGYDEERVIITKDIIEGLVHHFKLGNLKDDLLKALHQETARVHKNLKIKDPVE